MAPSSTPSAPPAERREPRIFETWEGNDVRAPSLHARSLRSIPERSRSRARLPRRVPTAGTTPSDLPPPSPHIFGSAAIFLRRAVHDRAVAGRTPRHVRARPDPVHRVQRALHGHRRRRLHDRLLRGHPVHPSPSPSTTCSSPSASAWLVLAMRCRFRSRPTPPAGAGA